jgi:hypothetical protein
MPVDRRTWYVDGDLAFGEDDQETAQKRIDMIHHFQIDERAPCIPEDELVSFFLSWCHEMLDTDLSGRKYATVRQLVMVLHDSMIGRTNMKIDDLRALHLQLRENHYNRPLLLQPPRMQPRISSSAAPTIAQMHPSRRGETGTSSPLIPTVAQIHPSRRVETDNSSHLIPFVAQIHPSSRVETNNSTPLIHTFAQTHSSSRLEPSILSRETRALQRATQNLSYTRQAHESHEAMTRSKSSCTLQ